MKKQILIISIILLTTSCSKESNNKHLTELAFLCKGKVSEFFPNQGLSWDDSHPETNDEVGLVIKGDKLTIMGSKSIIEEPIIYSKNASGESGWAFDICSNENHNLTFNNYSCNYNIFDNYLLKTSVKTYDGTFDGVTKTLIIKMQPLNQIEKLTKKDIFKTQHGIYGCLETKPSF
jgi:hypothetical protein